MCLNWGHTGSVCVCVRVHVGVSANPQTNLYIFAAVPRAPKELAASGMSDAQQHYTMGYTVCYMETFVLRLCNHFCVIIV